MNQKGNIMTAMIGGLMLIMGIMIYTVLHSPLVAMIFPYLDNTDTISGGPIIKAIIMLLPMVLIFVGVAMLVSEAFNRPPQIGYYQ